MGETRSDIGRSDLRRHDTEGRNGELGLTEGELGHTTVAALTDAEHRRWVTQCRGLEEGDIHPWPEAESRALVAAVLACLYGADTAAVAAPARAWARANPTMGIVVRRIGCLRELFAQEGVIGGGDSAARLAEILDKVTIHSTESALAALDAAAPVAEDIAGRAAPAPLLTRRRMAYGALGLAALAAVVLLALPSSEHHAPKASAHGAPAGAPPARGGGPAGSAGPSGAGADGTPVGPRTPSVGGPASGHTVVRTVDFGIPVSDGTPSGGTPSGGGAGATDGGSGGGTPGSSGTPPGGLPLPTLPAVPALPLPALPSLALPTRPAS